MNLRISFAAIALLFISGAAAAQSVAINDMFNRPNGPLGPDWNQIDGSAAIANNQLQGTNPWQFGWSAHTAYGATYQSTVVRARWQLASFGARVSVVAGVNPATWQGIEVRIADNNGNGLADRLFFNAAVNAGNWYGGSLFANITNQTSAGEVTVWFTNAGDTVNVELLDPASGMTETFTASGILGNPPTGTTVGVGYSGTGVIDDFRAWTGTPAGPVITSTAARVNTPLDLLVTEASPNGPIYIGYSLVGNGPTPSPWGTIQLTFPYEVLGMMPFNADGTGRVHIPLAPFPAAMTGLQIHVQSLDVVSTTLSNGFSATLF